MPDTPPQSCDLEVRVRYSETDAMGFLHHACYAVYFEMGRTELLGLSGARYRDMEEMGVFYVVARLECRYLAPAKYDDLLRLRTVTKKLTRVRVDHTYELWHDETLLAQARSTLACVGRDGRPTGLPDDLFFKMSGETREPGERRSAEPYGEAS